MEYLRSDSQITPPRVELVTKPTDADILPKTKEAFHQFPEQQGWKLDDEYKLELSIVPPVMELGRLLQSWLFFGLIFAVVQENGTSILDFDRLRSGQYLDAGSLRHAIEDWIKWELNNPDGRWIRLIQLEYVLEKAKRVVRKNCSSTLGYSDHGWMFTVQPDGYSTKKGDPRHLTDENALAFMTLGERLCAAKVRIINKCQAGLARWQKDDDGGWGLPRYVLVRIEQWCPHAVLHLKGQLRSSATMLLHFYLLYQHSMILEGHMDCTKHTCKVRTVDDNGDYTTICTDDCEGEGCAFIGPDMNEVYRILGEARESSAARGLRDIPFIRFNGANDADVTLAVEQLELYSSRPYATISHVWADGWGNERANALRTCQLRFIKRQLRQANGGRDILFWMDTLIVPVQEATMRPSWRELRTKAIRQIFEVFAKSKYTIVIDNGLRSMDPAEEEKPADRAMKILASGWMRRLWTLQETFLSKSHYVSFQEPFRGHQNLIKLEHVFENLEANASESLLVTPIRELLLQNTMSYESSFFNNLGAGHYFANLTKMQAAMLIAGTWRPRDGECVLPMHLSTYLPTYLPTHLPR